MRGQGLGGLGRLRDRGFGADPVLAGLGQAVLEGTTDSRPPSLADFVMSRAKPFFESSGAARQPGAAALPLWEATPAFGDIRGDLYYVRVTDAQPSRTPTLPEVADRVRQDAIAQAAQDKAKAAADALNGDGRNGRLTDLASSAGRTVVPLGTLQPGVPIAAMQLSNISQQVLLREAYNLLRADPSIEHPRTVVSLPRDGKVLVVELTSVVARAPGLDMTMLEMQSLQGMRLITMLDTLGRYYEPSEVAQRAKYVPTAAAAKRDAATSEPTGL